MFDGKSYDFNQQLPEEAKEKHVIITAIANAVRGEEIKEISLRLKRLRSDALKRSIEGRASGAHYAFNCVICKGTGKAHFCIDPFCHSPNELEQDDCLHFTPSELQTYLDIHRDYASLLLEVDRMVKAAGSDASTFMSLLNLGKSKGSDHGFN